MRRRLLGSYIIGTIVILLLLEVPLGVLETRREHDALEASARRDAIALSVLASEDLAQPGRQDLDDLATRYRKRAGSEVAIMDSTGTVLVSLDPDESAGGSNELEPLMRRALTGATYALRRSDEGQAQLVAVQPVTDGDGVLGAVAVAVSATASDHRIQRAWLALALLGGAILALAGSIGVVLARSVTAPLTRLQGAAARFGEGDLDTRVVPEGPPEIADLSDEFNKMARRVADLVEDQRHFVADASHQLRTPLTSIRLRLENLAADLSETTADDAIAEIQSEVDRLGRMVDGLLALSRAETPQPMDATADVADVVADRIQAWGALADEREVTLVGPVSSAGSRDVRVGIDPRHLEQILDNLLANALEVSPSGSTIEIEAHVTVDRVTVHVRDEGPGLDDRDRARAFDRFWQGSNHETGSSGLGLAIVKELVTAAGGTVALDSPGRGIDATLTLPRTSDAALPR